MNPGGTKRPIRTRKEPAGILGHVTTRERRLDRANRRLRRALAEIGEELRETRVQAGLTQRDVGAILGCSHSHVGRIERGLKVNVPYGTLVRLGAVLGLDVPLRAYPNGDPVRDAAQLALLARLRALLPPGIQYRAEVPLGILGDLRAWDAVIAGRDWTLPVEAETRLRDVQALLRRQALKSRDAAVDRVLLVVADTRHNRHVLRLAGDDFAAAYPLRGREALADLRDGRRPRASAVLLV
jgi:transcriptional regulator with XRE-family HTH domain